MSDIICPILAQCTCSDVDECCREEQCAWWVPATADDVPEKGLCAIAAFGIEAVAKAIQVSGGGFNDAD